MSTQSEYVLLVKNSNIDEEFSKINIEDIFRTKNYMDYQDILDILQINFQTQEQQLSSIWYLCNQTNYYFSCYKDRFIYTKQQILEAPLKIIYYPKITLITNEVDNNLQQSIQYGYQQTIVDSKKIFLFEKLLKNNLDISKEENKDDNDTKQYYRYDTQNSLLSTFNELDSKNDCQQINLAFLYSEPLVSKQFDMKQLFQIQDFLDESISQIKFLHNQKKEIYSFASVLNQRNLRKAINLKPQILHLNYRNGGSEFDDYLYIQCEEEGLLQKVKISSVSKAIQDMNHEIKLVFLNGIYSHKTGQKLILSKNINVIISIINCSEIQDKLSVEFFKKFYNNIFNGNTIYQSYMNTIQELENDDKYYNIFNDNLCCCYHDHTDTCLFKKQIKNIYRNIENGDQRVKKKSLLQYHFQYLRNCTCQKLQQFNQHKKNCKFVNDQLITDNLMSDSDWEFEANFENIFLQDNLTQKNSKNTKHIQFKTDKYIYQCCCQQPSVLKHNHNLKFQIIYKNGNEDYGRIQLFENKKTNYQQKMQIVNRLNLDQLYLNLPLLIGFNQHIYKMFSETQNNNCRLIVIRGNKGCGKTQIAKRFSNYCIERNLYDKSLYYSYIFKNNENQKQKNLQLFINSILQAIKDQQQSHNNLLFILDDMEDVMNEFLKQIQELMIELIKNKNCCFIIICETKKHIEEVKHTEIKLKEINKMDNRTKFLIVMYLLKQQFQYKLTENEKNIYRQLNENQKRESIQILTSKNIAMLEIQKIINKKDEKMWNCFKEIMIKKNLQDNFKYIGEQLKKSLN